MNRVLWIASALMLNAACNAPAEEDETLRIAVEQLMPDFSKTLNVSQGFNFKKDLQSRVGFLTALKIGGYEMAADLNSIKDPQSPDAVLNNGNGAVAVLSHISWDTSRTGSIQLTGQISTENQQKLSEMLQGTMTDTSVIFSFDVYEYDQKRSRYVKTGYVDQPLHGLIEQQNQGLKLEVADTASTEVQSPRNYQFTISIKPKSIDQEVYLLVGEQRVKASLWGVKEKAAKQN